MNYKLERELGIKQNIASVAESEVNAALESLENLGIHDAIHDIRKRLKKLRGLARLFRDELGEKEYKKINIFYRDLGRELADIRDLTAHKEILEKIRNRYGEHLYVNFFNTINTRIDKKRDELEKELKTAHYFSEEIPKKLNYAKKNLVVWPIGTNDLEIILPSIQRVYRRGRKALKQVQKDPSKEIYHEWRKRVKYLYYQLELLESLWPGLFKAWLEEVHRLSDYLGDDHDLMILDTNLNSGNLSLKDHKQEELIHALIKEYSEHLRDNAIALGKLIYAEKPKHFSKRIKTYISA